MPGAPVKPIIGVSAEIRELDGQFGMLQTQMVARTYTRAVRQAGGIPVLLPAEDVQDIDRVLDRVDAVVLTGGGDLDPDRHGRHRHTTVHGIVSDRDEYELALVLRIRERGMPLLAVCRGVQVANVALGGDLVVDIPSEVGHDVVHRIPDHGVVARHRVRIDAGSRLAEVLGVTSAEVSSSHHQSIRRLGDGLRAAAWAPDDVVEGIEAVGADWPFWGVQWHPEVRPPDGAAARRPFEAIVEVAGARVMTS